MLRTWACAAALLLVTAASAFAQFDRGTLSGTIKDEQGAVMPGVTVTARNTQTQQVVTTVTDGTGFYTFPNLLPGRYDILAELQGFKTIKRDKRETFVPAWYRVAALAQELAQIPIAIELVLV